MQAAAEEREQADAHLVSPMQVLEDNHQEVASGHAREELADRLEEVPRVSASADGHRARHRRCPWELGQEPAELGARLERVEAPAPRAPGRS